MAVRTIVLSRHGSNLARPVIIHDIIHGLIYVPSTPCCGFFEVSLDGNCAYVHWGSFTSNSKSVRRAIWFTWFSERYDSVYGTWQSQAVTHPIMNRARRRLTSVIEQILMSERRILYSTSQLVLKYWLKTWLKACIEPFQAWIYHCNLHPLQAANCCRNSRLVVNEDDLNWVTLVKIYSYY